MIRGLNEDEADYLEMLEKNKNNSQKEQIMEEKRELEDFRKQVANLKEQDATNIVWEWLWRFPLPPTALIPNVSTFLSTFNRKHV